MQRLTIILIAVAAIVLFVTTKHVAIREFFGGHGKATIETTHNTTTSLPNPKWHAAECIFPATPTIWRLRNFLSADECKHIIDQANQQGFRPDPSVSVATKKETNKKETKTQPTTFISQLTHTQTSVTKSIQQRASSAFGCPVQQLQVKRYHHASSTTNDAEVDFLPHITGRAGQRYATINVFLNDDFQGGTLSFPKCGKEAKPVAGDAISWYNCRATSSRSGCVCFDQSSHIQQPSVTPGKPMYILTIWMQFNAT